MTLSPPHRADLEARLRDIRENRPIDNVQIERAVLALLHAVLEGDAAEATAAMTR